MKTWNLETIRTLRWMLALGSSLAEIAVRLGTTRGAVAGKAARLRAERIQLGQRDNRPAIELPPRGWAPV